MGWITCVAKNSDATSWHELLHQLGLFCTEFRNSTKRSQCPKIIRNAPKHEFWVQWGGSGAFIAKNSDATSWHELLHQFGPFCTEFRKATKRSQMHPNSSKRTKTPVLGPMGWIGCVPYENSDATSRQELLHQFGPFCAEFRKATKRFQMHPNSMKHSKTLV